MRVVVFDDVLFTRQQDYAGLGPEGSGGSERHERIDLRFFEHADDAVAVVQRERPDLVLMDYSMDDHQTGEEAIVALRSRWPRGKLKIIGISSDSHSNERMVAAGADQSMLKSHLRGYLRMLARRLGERSATGSDDQ